MTGTELTKYQGSLDDKLTWDDIILNEETKEELKDFCSYRLVDHKAYKRWGCKPPKGILLYGPPGTGKSLIMAIIGTLSPFPFFSIDVANIGSSLLNESPRKLDKVFRIARNVADDQTYKVAGLLLDEMDGLLMRRDSIHTHAEDHKVVTIFTQNMSGLKANPGVYVIGSTNLNLEEMDQAVIRAQRFDDKIYIGLPDDKARADIFKLHLEKADKEARETGHFSFMRNVDYDLLGSQTSGFSGADIKTVIDKLCIRKLREEEKAGRTSPISTEELLGLVVNYELTSQRGKKDPMGFKP